MQAESWSVDLETLRRFDRPGPRYTSYPTAVEFHDGVTERDYRRLLGELPAEPVSLYLHLPFCEERCDFCACHVVITKRRDVAARYLSVLLREIDLVASVLGDRRQVAQLHWGGGTPTYFSPGQLEELFGHLGKTFELLPEAEVAVEVDPRVTTTEHLETLARLGFNRLSLGVQDFTPEVQAAIGRNQTREETIRLVETARRVGFSGGINIDQVYGLPTQSEEGFRSNLAQAVQLRPDRVAMYSFAFVPWMKVNQRRIDEALLPAPEVKLRLYLAALEAFLEAGYQPIGMDHFALPDDELAVAARQGRLERNFMGYTVKPASRSIAFGISGIGDLGGGYVQNEKKLSTYYRAIDDDRLPIERGVLLDADDQLRRYVITRLMCSFRVDKGVVRQRFGVEFDEVFAGPLSRLGEMAEAGMIEDSPEALAVVGNGRLFVRNAAMVFDSYLEAKLASRPVFSRTV